MGRLLHRWFALPAWKKILAGLIAGIITGLIFREKAAYLQPIGIVFIHLIQMLVAPVVFTAIVCAVISIQDISKMKKFLGKALVLYASAMAIAAGIGICVANLIGVGHGVPAIAAEHGATTLTAATPLTFGTILIGFVPTSAVAAFASNNVIQILLFSFLFGFALRLVGDKGKPIQTIFLSLSEVVFKFAKIIVGFAPYGVFALIASVIGLYGMSILFLLVKLVVTVYLSCAILIVFVYAPLLWVNGLHPKQFLKHVVSALVTAYTTSSSAATLPVTMRCARENLKVDRSVSDFLLPLGATLNLNGLAIYLGVASIFAAHLFGITLGFEQYLTLVIAIIFSAAGAAAIPSSGLIVMSAVMTSVGIPLAAIPIIAGADRFNDMAQTMTNVAGDLVAAALVAKSEGLIIGDDHEQLALT